MSKVFMDLLEELHKSQPTLKNILKSHLNDIKKGLDEGYTKKKIYKIFKEEKIIHCNYPYFIVQLNKIIQN
ncbi:MAG: hypothetical protein KKD66_14685 [Proteobacteria bacterium]|nr:hypothetical protein [Pseudomonadota bacterium]